MQLSWSDYAKLYWPFLLLGAVSAIGGFYSFAYADGQRSILRASERAAKEAKHG